MDQPADHVANELAALKEGMMRLSAWARCPGCGGDRTSRQCCALPWYVIAYFFKLGRPTHL
jgi:hypothetical protein